MKFELQATNIHNRALIWGLHRANHGAELPPHDCSNVTYNSGLWAVTDEFLQEILSPRYFLDYKAEKGVLSENSLFAHIEIFAFCYRNFGEIQMREQIPTL